MKKTEMPLGGLVGSSFTFQLFLFAAFLLSGDLLAAAPDFVPDENYYVSPSGDDATNDGSRAFPFKTIGRAASKAAADQTKTHRVFVKAGVYKESVFLNSSALKNIVFEGYKTNPGDIDPTQFNYTPGAPLNSQEMPLLQGDDTLNKGFFMSTPNRNVTLRNFQIEGYRQRGVEMSGSHDNTLENIIVKSVTSHQGSGSFGGEGIRCAGNGNKIRHCVAVNCWGTNIAIAGDGNTAEQCKAYCDENATDNGTDYYFLVNGDDNVITSCELNRAEGIEHGGHGFMTQGGDNNKFTDCHSNNVAEGIQLLALKGSVTFNTFTDCTITKGSIVLSTEANENKFVNCTVNGDGGRSGVTFWKSYPKEYIYNGSELPAHDNLFYACTFENLQYGIDFNHTHSDEDGWGGPAARNSFAECKFTNVYGLVRTQRPNDETTFLDSQFSRILHFHANDGYPFANPKFNGCEFSDNGFQSPFGSGNTTVNRDPKYPLSGDIHSGLVGHWKFDEVQAGIAIDSSGSGADGQLIGNAVWHEAGKLGGCIRLDGQGDYIDIGDRLDLVRSDMTIAAWIKADEVTSFDGIVSKWDNYSFGFGKDVDSNLNALTLGCRAWPLQPAQSAGAYDTPFEQQSGSVGYLPVQRWYHVAAVFDLTNERLRIYVDGIKRTNDGAQLTSPRADVNASLLIGKYGGGFLDGLIDDVRIYNRALDDDDMKSLANLRANLR